MKNVYVRVPNLWWLAITIVATLAGIISSVFCLVAFLLTL